MSSDNAEQHYTEMCNKMASQLEQALELYDEMDPKDRLIMHLMSTVNGLEQMVYELRASRTGWATEIDTIRERLDNMDTQIKELRRTVSQPMGNTAEVEKIVKSFVKTSKKRHKKRTRRGK